MNTTNFIYPIDISCPRCGSKANESCKITFSDGPTDLIRSPHRERIELAHNYNES